MSIFKATQLTNKGKGLLAKIIAGQTELKFTAMQAGDGYYDGDVEALEALVSWRMDGYIVGIRAMGLFAELDCYVNNETLTEMMEFREIGILANDPDEGDILFCYTNAGDNASLIGAWSGIWLHEEHFTIRAYTANAENVKAEISATAFASQTIYDNRDSGLASDRVQGAIDELKMSSDSLKPVVGEDNPTASTQGVIGQMYLSTATSDWFMCLGHTEEDGYIWSMVGSNKTLLGNDNPIGSTRGALGQMFFNKTSGALFVCVGAETGSYVWLLVGGGSGGDDIDVAWLGASFAGAAYLIGEAPDGGGGFPDGGETGTGDVALISANVHVGDNPPADRAKVWYDTKADNQV